MRRLALLLALLPCPAARADEVPRPTGDAIVAPDAKLELLFTRTAPIKGGLTEGPAAAPDGSIYFSDIAFGLDKGMILRFDPKTRRTTVFAADSHKSNGLKFDARGRLLACEGADGGGRCVSRWDVKSKKREVIADRYVGKRFNSPNDLWLDGEGNVYFTDPRYLGDEPRELKHEAVYRINRDGTVMEITHEVEKPNGIALSADRAWMYVADHNSGSEHVDRGGPLKHGAMKVYAFPLGRDGLVAGPRKTLVDFGGEAGCDGMTRDRRGNLYLAVRSLKRPGVLVLSPATGRELAFIPTGPSQPGAKAPRGIPANCCFGVGAESKVLYVTVDTSLYRITLRTEGPAGPGRP
jgi:gluconolactonase